MLPGIIGAPGLLAGGVKTAPTIVTSLLDNSVSGSASSKTLTLPSGLVIPNKLIVGIDWRTGTGSATPGTGYTEIYDTDELEIAWRTIDGSETNPSWTTTAARSAWGMIQVGNCSSDAPQVAASASVGSTANAVPPSLTPTGWGSDPVLYLVFLRVNSSTDVSAAPSGYSGFATTRASTDPSFSWAWKVGTAAGETPGAFTSPAADFAAQTIAIRGI